MRACISRLGSEVLPAICDTGKSLGLMSLLQTNQPVSLALRRRMAEVNN